MMGGFRMIANPGEAHVIIDTGDSARIESILKLKEQYPEKVRIAQRYRDGSVKACVPVEWVKISVE